MQVAELVALLSLKGDQFEKGLSNAEKQSKGFGGSVGGVFKNVALGVAGIAIAAGGAAIGIAAKATDLAESLQKVQALMWATFGQTASAVGAWAEQNQKALGVTDVDLLKNLNTWGLYAKGIGESTGTAAKSGEELAQRAAQISAVTGRSFDDVFGALQKGVEGATKGLKTYGVAIDPVILRNEALKLGLISGKEKLDAHSKAVATEALILAQTTPYVAAFGTAQGTAGFQMKDLGVIVDHTMVAIGQAVAPIVAKVLPMFVQGVQTASDFIIANLPTIIGIFEQVGTVIGQALGDASVVIGWFIKNVLPTLVSAFDYVSSVMLPMLASAFDWISTNVLPVLAAVIDWMVKNVLPALGVAFTWFATVALPAVANAIDWVTKNVLPPLTAAFDWVTKNVLPPLVAALSWLAVNILPAVEKAIEFVTKDVLPPLGAAFSWIVKTVMPPVSAVFGFLVNNVLPPVVAAIGFLTGTVIPAIGAAFSAVAKIIGAVWSGITSAIKGAVNAIIGIINGIIGAIDSIQLHIDVKPPIGPEIKFDWNGIGLGKLGYLASGTPNWAGGWAVLGEQGPELARLPGGTQVFPASQTAAMLGARGSSPLIGHQTIYGVQPDEVERQTRRAIRRGQLELALNGGRL